MPHLHQIDTIEIINQLPEIKKLEGDFLLSENDVLILASGFEDRCLAFVEQKAKVAEKKAAACFYLRYETNQSDNDINLPRILEKLGSLSNNVEPINCDGEDYCSDLRTKLTAQSAGKSDLHIVFDISGCSAKLIILTMKILLEEDFNLSIVYTESVKYAPSKEEYQENKKEYTEDSGFGLARGIGQVYPSPEHPGRRRDGLTEYVFAFPTFKPERTKAILLKVDPSLAQSIDDRVHWFIGRPHLEEHSWRVDVIKEVNNIHYDYQQSSVISTFDYKETFHELDRVYSNLRDSKNCTVAPLGSKNQCIAISLFCQVHQEISIVFATPEEYNAKHYSEGCRDIWVIDFGSCKNIVDLLRSVGNLEIQTESESN